MLSRRLFLALTGGALASPFSSLGVDEVPTLLDHLLLGCSDLDRGIDFVEKHTGVRAAFGGVHPGRGTRNALLALGEKHYLEIIAPDPKQQTPDVAPMVLRSAAHLLLQLESLTTPRLVDWAAHPGDLNQFATRLRNANLAFDGPNPGSRKRPDGRLLQWQTLNLKDDCDGLLPFFIEWSADTIHPSADAPAGCRIMRFELATPDPEKLGKTAALLGLGVEIVNGTKAQIRATLDGPKGELSLSS
ncbi:MAG TPA: VOC family protein [Candidatus Acidoferrum sp.]|nr:VOC family protein [Candidatus Acidoferrum sp.]